MNKPLPHPQISEPVSKFLAGKHQAFIAGKWQTCRPARRLTLSIREPDGSSLKSPSAMRPTWTRLLLLLRGPYLRAREPDNGQRPRQMMWKFAELIEKHADELAELESLNHGKPLANVRNVDLMLGCETLRYTAGWATKITGETIALSSAPKTHAFTVREPIGVVGQIIPWNSPIMMATWKLAPALATGCTVVLKPAEQTPLTALYLARLIQEAGIPGGVVNIVPGRSTAGAAIAAHPDIDKVAFTGSWARSAG